MTQAATAVLSLGTPYTLAGWLGAARYPLISRLAKAYVKEVASELGLQKEGDLNICIKESHASKGFAQKHSVRGKN